ncbi:hypothetical protein [Bradyrhizobium sp. BR 1432]|uniref:hypothetical protein n=1 Tax=Bradyrhizobium sp. BR 1432 TaxID=3447966 RepID=UPI003EE59807
MALDARRPKTLDLDEAADQAIFGSGMEDAPLPTVLAAILNEMTFAGYSNMQATGN